MFEHHFNVGIAKKYGINVAIFLNNVAFWVNKNQANKKHLHEGRYWTYNSSEALTELFPYWSIDQIDRLIKKCVESGLLLTGNFNETAYDRTRWFGLSDEGLTLFNITIPQNRGMDTAKKDLPFREIAEPIPDNKPDNKPRERATSLPHDFRIKQDHIEHANHLNHNPDVLFFKFRNHCLQTGKTSLDWDATFHIWIANEKTLLRRA